MTVVLLFLVWGILGVAIFFMVGRYLFYHWFSVLLSSRSSGENPSFRGRQAGRK